MLHYEESFENMPPNEGTASMDREYESSPGEKIVLPGVFFKVIRCECQSTPLPVTAQHPVDPDVSNPCLDSALPQQSVLRPK